MKHYDYVLGLDLGVASLGWALIEIDDNAQPISLNQDYFRSASNA